jgi:two-component system response regulator CssR
MSKVGPKQLGDISIDIAAHQAMVGQNEIYLTLNEFKLLQLFLQKGAQVVSRAEIRRRVWGDGPFKTDRAINTLVCRLRKKIESIPKSQMHLVSIRSLGYKLRK